MKKFVIVSDSCCDLSKGLRDEYGIEYIPMHFTIEGKEYLADLDWKEISVKNFYDTMRKSTRIFTAQVNTEQYREAFEKYIQEGFDILYISCSSALSASIKASYVIRDELKEKYPESKIICLDGLNSSCGLGILCLRASELRAEGKTIEEAAQIVGELRAFVNQDITPEKLSYLKQAGRVSAASAFFGGLLNIKPIIISDAKGQNVAIEKVKGRQVSMERIVELFAENYQDVPYQKIMICHGDCIEDAKKLKDMLLKKLNMGTKVYIENIGSIVGASVGPGTVAVQFFGKEVTLNKE